MDLKIAARMCAVLALGAAMTAAVMALRGDGPGNGAEDAPAQSLHHPGGEPAHSPLGRGELARCRDLGMAAADAAACRRAWAENRRRFFSAGMPDRPTPPRPERFGSVPPPAGDVADEAPSSKAKDRLPFAATDEAGADAEEAPAP
ncbi:putative entry exclusion protein TrbK-alt [Corticibacterium sp. UT-5YL-CI-8]|nr:putative entry exclusion protein TrbK-alt [Tianweitania sp. UT-5YL-CI-8]